MHAWNNDWQGVLQYASAEQMAILEKHRAHYNIKFPQWKDLIYICVKVGNIDALQFVMSRAHQIRENREFSNLFLGACANGHLHMVKWLTCQFNLTVDDVRENDNRALRGSCTHR